MSVSCLIGDTLVEKPIDLLRSSNAAEVSHHRRRVDDPHKRRAIILAPRAEDQARRLDHFASSFAAWSA
jgi:hypothetical protein